MLNAFLQNAVVPDFMSETTFYKYNKFQTLDSVSKTRCEAAMLVEDSIKYICLNLCFLIFIKQ